MTEKNSIGWQKQPNKLNIQGEIERAIQNITGEQVELIGSGRTDAGVHAFGQVANFKIDSDFPIEKMAIAINSQLKKSIRIKKTEEVSQEFHSRYNCHSKTYQYVIDNSEQGSAIYRGLSYHVPQELDVEKMQKAVTYFVGEHDFSSFKSSGTSSKSSVRIIYDANVEKDGEKVKISLTGNGFLYNMVRIMTGALIDVGHKKIAPEDIKTMLEEKDRTKAADTAPAKGLYLYKVSY